MTATFGGADDAWLQGLRRDHFPPERNLVPAHLTLFHALPPSVGPELAQRLAAATDAPPPAARITGVRNLGRGTALAVASEALEDMRADLADAFAPLLTPQDRAPWRPHVTVQNKVEPPLARALQARLSAEIDARPLHIRGLATWGYAGGPWDPIRHHAFRRAA